MQKNPSLFYAGLIGPTATERALERKARTTVQTLEDAGAPQEYRLPRDEQRKARVTELLEAING